MCGCVAKSIISRGEGGLGCDLVKLYAERRLTATEMRIMRFVAVTEHEPKTNPELDTR